MKAHWTSLRQPLKGFSSETRLTRARLAVLRSLVAIGLAALKQPVL